MGGDGCGMSARSPRHRGVLRCAQVALDIVLYAAYAKHTAVPRTMDTLIDALPYVDKEIEQLPGESYPTVARHPHLLNAPPSIRTQGCRAQGDSTGDEEHAQGISR